MVNVVFGCVVFEDFVVACRGYRIFNCGKLEIRNGLSNSIRSGQVYTKSIGEKVLAVD